MSQKYYRTFLIWAILITCWITTCVYGQVNSQLDQPFILNSGTPYRDRLTIATSQAVAEYAKTYERRQRSQVGKLFYPYNIKNQGLL